MKKSQLTGERGYCKIQSPFSTVVLLAFAAGARAADKIVLNVTGDNQTLAAALTAYNDEKGTA